MIENSLGPSPRSLIRLFRRFAAVVAVAAAGLSSWPLWSPARAASASAAVPPYYVALRVLSPACCSPGKPFAPRTDAVVRATTTGAVIAHVAVPKPYFTFVAVSGEADDRTFVLAAQRLARYPLNPADDPASQLFLLRIHPTAATASGRATLTALPIPVLPKGVDLNGIAVSPDGSKLAVNSTSWITSGQPVIAELHVFDMVTGAERSWLGVVFGQGLLSWAADSTTLQLFGCKLGAARVRLLLLDVAKPGDDLVANSRIVNVRGGGNVWRGAAISGNGRIIAAVRAFLRPRAFYERLVKIDVRTGKVISTLNVKDTLESVLWASQTGMTLIVTGAGRHNGGAGSYTGTRYTPIPWQANLLTAAW